MRLDTYLATYHNVTRNRAQQLIATDLILVNHRVCNKASFQVVDSTIVTITADRRVEWVSRSAEKLAGFLEEINMQNIICKILDTNCLDIGSSTGGFTQVLLGYGATHIDAVDVGTDQLHLSLRSDMRVSSYEQTDIRDLAKMKHDPYDIIVCDASFISLVLIFDAILQLTSPHSILILLYKPQFEVGREYLRKTGIPKDIKIVEEKMKEFEILLDSKNMRVLKKAKSSLVGEAGNQEWIYMVQQYPHT